MIMSALAVILTLCSKQQTEEEVQKDTWNHTQKRDCIWGIERAQDVRSNKICNQNPDLSAPISGRNRKWTSVQKTVDQLATLSIRRALSFSISSSLMPTVSSA